MRTHLLILEFNRLFSWRLNRLNWALLVLRQVQSLSHVRLLATTWTVARQASLSFTISQSLLKLMSIESVMSSNHLEGRNISYPVLRAWVDLISEINYFSKLTSHKSEQYS